MKFEINFDFYYFLFFTLLLLVLFYIYTFHHANYKKWVQTIFRKNEEEIREKEYDLLLYSYTLFYIAYFIIAPFCKKRIYNIAETFYKNYHQKPLYDLLHQIIPYSKYSKYIREGITIFIVISIFFFFFLKPNISFFYSLLFTYGILIILRSFLFNLTLLPKSTHECNYSTYFSSCNDLLFSGHVSKILILLILANKYNIIPNHFVNIYYFLFFIMIYFILSSRGHYTIDIIIAILIVYFIYFMYNKMLKIYLYR